MLTGSGLSWRYVVTGGGGVAVSERRNGGE